MFLTNQTVENTTDLTMNVILVLAFSQFPIAARFNLNTVNETPAGKVVARSGTVL